MSAMVPCHPDRHASATSPSLLRDDQKKQHLRDRLRAQNVLSSRVTQEYRSAGLSSPLKKCPTTAMIAGQNPSRVLSEFFEHSKRPLKRETKNTNLLWTSSIARLSSLLAFGGVSWIRKKAHEIKKSPRVSGRTIQLVFF